MTNLDITIASDEESEAPVVVFMLPLGQSMHMLSHQENG